MSTFAVLLAGGFGNFNGPLSFQGLSLSAIVLRLAGGRRPLGQGHGAAALRARDWEYLGVASGVLSLLRYDSPPGAVVAVVVDRGYRYRRDQRRGW